MRILDHKVARIRGTLILELADGREGSVDVDIDVEDDRTVWGVDHEYGEESLYLSSRWPKPALATTYSIQIPASLREEPQFIVRVPAE